MVQRRLSGANPNRGKSFLVSAVEAVVMSAPPAAMLPTMPAMKGHDALGGSHGDSHAGADPRQWASRAANPVIHTRSFTKFAPNVSGTSLIPLVPSTHTMNSSSVTNKNAPRAMGNFDDQKNPMMLKTIR